MAMSPANVVIPDNNVPYSGGGGAATAGGGNEIHRHQWFPVDERDGLISWLRGEFAAANAIIDSLCHHLRLVGEPGEYDLVIGNIQRRRCNWNHVLHMQQYFSVGDVILALQQVVWRKQQQQHRYYYDHSKVGHKEFKRSSSVGFSKGQRGGEVVKEVAKANVESNSVDGNSSGNVGTEKFEDVKWVGDGEKLEDMGVVAEDKKDANSRVHGDNHLNSSVNSEGTLCGNSEAEVAVADRSSPKGNDSHSNQNHNEKQNLDVIPKTFVATEIIDGKKLNVVDGLKLYERFLDESEVSKLVSLVDELRAAGKRGQYQGQTYVVFKRPMKGHGREMIQLGLPIADAAGEDENAAGTSKDRKIDSIPALLQDFIERLVGMQVITMKPDSCIIDVYNEGDHSQPHIVPPWFGKPVSVLFLTECDLTFGRVITAEPPGDYRGSLKLSLEPGSVLVMQGKSSDFAKHAIPAISKQRMLVTFAKSQPKKFASNDGQRFPSPAVAASSHWGPTPSRSLNHVRHPVPKHYVANQTTGVLPAPPIRPQIPPPNGVQPLFVTASVAAPMHFPAAVAIPPVSTGWSPSPARHSSARLLVPVPGTGVFLPPPGSGNGSSTLQLPATASETNLPVDTASLPENEEGTGKSSHVTSTCTKEKLDGKTRRQDCNGIVDGRDATKEEQQSVDHVVGNKSTVPV